MVTAAELQRRGLPYAVVVDGAATPASLQALDRQGLPYLVEVADGATMASRRALEARGLRYLVPVLVDATPASKASLAAQGLRYAVQVDADILPADRLVLQRQGLACYVEVDSSGNSVAAAAGGGAALLAGETDGFATDFTYATDTQRVALKASSVVTSYALDNFIANAGTSPKLVYDVAGALVWSPHNMFLNSAAPVTQNVTTVVGQNYTVTVTGSGSMTGSAGASGVATAGSPLTYTATTTTSTFTKAGTVTQIQMNRGAVATAHLSTTAAIRNGLAVDYDPVTHAAKGLLNEPGATNLLLNNTSLSTQSVTVTAVAYTLSFWGTGTVTLSGVSTAGPLVGTGANDRVSLTFTPTAGSLTCTVTGTVTRAQLETGTVATSSIPTFAASATRAPDNYSVTPASINHSATAGSWWVQGTFSDTVSSPARVIGYTAATSAPLMYRTASPYLGLFDSTVLVKSIASLGLHKIASAFQAGDRAFTADGLAAVTDAGSTASLLAPGAAVGFGNANGGNLMTGWIAKVRYVPRRKTNAELVSETSA